MGNSVSSDFGHEKRRGPRSPSEIEIQAPNPRSSRSFKNQASVFPKSNKRDLIPSHINRFPNRLSVNEYKHSWADDVSENEPDGKSFLKFWKPLTVWKSKQKEISSLKPFDSDCDEDPTPRESRATFISQARSSDVSSIYFLERRSVQYWQNHPASQRTGRSMCNLHTRSARSSGIGTHLSKGFLSDFVHTRRLSNNISLLSRLWPKNALESKESPVPSKFARQHNQANLQDMYWEQEMQDVTYRRRKVHSRNRKWGEQSIERIIKKMEKLGTVMDTKSYFTVFRLSNGRTWPKQELLLSVIWTTIFLCIHSNYLDLSSKIFAKSFNPWFSYSLINYFGIALGYLLYMQAESSSRRWVEGRVQWQLIVESSKTLTVLFNTHLTCLRLARYSTRLLLGHTICIRNQVQRRKDKVWKANMLEVLDQKFVEEVMRYPRRLRYLVLLYGLQRLVEYCIDKGILPIGVIRDINPTITKMSHSLGACNRIRFTKLPYIIALHLQFILMIFIIVLPMTLVGLQEQPQAECTMQLTYPPRFNILEIYGYEIVIAYAYFGLSRMAIDVDDPFSFTRENHSFGYWGFYELWSSVELEILRVIYFFRGRRNGNNVKNSGCYGEKWVSEKLKIPIQRAIDSKLSKEHNLYGRTNEIRQQLRVNQRNSSYWDGFKVETIHDNDDDSFTFASEPEDENFTTPQSHVRRSICYDRTISTTRKKRLSALFSKFTLRLPATQRVF